MLINICSMTSILFPICSSQFVISVLVRNIIEEQQQAIATLIVNLYKMAIVNWLLLPWNTVRMIGTLRGIMRNFRI